MEPASERDTRDILLRQLEEFTFGVPEESRLEKYPTMHLRHDRGEEAEVRYDYMIETDPPSWRRSFDDLIPALDVLDAHNACYRIKFSGHRSLHLIIPAESMPVTFRGKPLNEQFDQVQKKLDSFLPLPQRYD